MILAAGFVAFFLSILVAERELAPAPVRAPSKTQKYLAVELARSNRLNLK